MSLEFQNQISIQPTEESGGGGGGGTPSVGIPREVTAQGVLQIPTDLTSWSLPKGATSVGAYALNNAFRGCASLTDVDLSNLISITGNQGLNSAFYGCTNLTSIDFSNLETADVDYALYNICYGCTSLTTVTFPKLKSINASRVFQTAFQGCTSLTDVYFPALTTTSCGSNTSIFMNMLYQTTATAHFPSNTLNYIPQNDISGRVAFDLPATT